MTYLLRPILRFTSSLQVSMGKIMIWCMSIVSHALRESATGLWPTDPKVSTELERGDQHGQQPINNIIIIIY